MALRIGLLGSLYVIDDDRDVMLPAGKQRVVLAALALGANQTVSLDTLAEAVWDGRPPATAEATIRNYVRRLRQALGPGGNLETRRRGYRLILPERQLDLTVFESLCRQGLAADETGWESTRVVLHDALNL